MNAKTILTAAALAAAFVTGAAQASTSHGEVYGYTYRVNDQRSAFTDGARQGKFDVCTNGEVHFQGKKCIGIDGCDIRWGTATVRACPTT